MDVYLETERLILRRFTEDDANHLLELDSDPDVMRFLTGGRATSRAEVESEILPHLLRWHERSEKFGYFAAVGRGTDEFLGWFEFRPPKGRDDVELGYRLRKSAWGKGYATEGSRALVHKGFAELGVRRVFAETMAVNHASRRVMEKSGLVYVRTFRTEWPYRIEGEEEGDVEYALSREEWEEREREVAGSGVSASAAEEPPEPPRLP